MPRLQVPARRSSAVVAAEIEAVLASCGEWLRGLNLGAVPSWYLRLCGLSAELATTESDLTATRQALSEYGQHKADCNSRLCRHEACKLGTTESWVAHERGSRYYGHDFEPRECSCGLAEALNRGTRDERTTMYR